MTTQRTAPESAPGGELASSSNVHRRAADDDGARHAPLPRAWLVLAFRRRGVEDTSVTSYYNYDSQVPNHGGVAVGDLLLVRGPRELEGIARVRRIEEENATKRRLVCPVCRSGSIRSSDTPAGATYRCDRGHAFAEPHGERSFVRRFTAVFDGAYVAARAAIDLPTLRAACPAWNGQLAIQPIDLEAIRARVEAVPGFRERLLAGAHRPELGPDDASLVAAYVPGNGDMRAVAHRQLRERRGPVRFRRALIARHGARCMISGCNVADLLEAAHIRPFRGPGYEALENGLLLRADLHTLFDLDLLGIDPETLTVRLHPNVANGGYAAFEGARLDCVEKPSNAALELRWTEFLLRLRRA